MTGLKKKTKTKIKHSCVSHVGDSKLEDNVHALEWPPLKEICISWKIRLQELHDF